MFSAKRFSVLTITAIIAVSTVIAQTNNDMTVEESYLQESIELMIIREMTRTTTREQKLVALEFIGDAIKRGSKNDEIRSSLEYLSKEGVRSVARENGRMMNNFPEIRRESAKYLGLLGTDEARKILLDICTFENEPMVLQEVIKSLGDIGSDDNDTLKVISWVVSRFNNLVPDNLVALATIDAFENIAKTNNGLNSPEAIRTLTILAEGHYIAPVKDRAKKLLSELRGYSG